MRQTQLAIPDLALIAGTRAALGAGLGLLLGEYLGGKERRAVGWALVAVGVLTTVPLVLKVLGSRPGGSRETAIGALGTSIPQEVREMEFFAVG